MVALWSIYELILSYMTCSYMYTWDINVATKQKANKTVMGHNKHNNQKWNTTRSLELRIRDKSENGEQ